MALERRTISGLLVYMHFEGWFGLRITWDIGYKNTGYGNQIFPMPFLTFDLPFVIIDTTGYMC